MWWYGPTGRTRSRSASCRWASSSISGTATASSKGWSKGAELPLEYELEVSYPAGDSYVLRDPYSFLPTLGELDVHLAGEGRHEELYARLGAHPRVLDGIAGVSFAVWAPNAASVSVVGDFNGWDGRLHPMRSLGASGIWELFVPDVRSGARTSSSCARATASSG